jgi:hypothetical protein
VKPLAAPIVAKSVLTPEKSAPPRVRRERPDTPPDGQRQRRWFAAMVPPARILLGRRPTA